MEKSPLNPANSWFRAHPRAWRTFHYVYPVISRRSGGLSIGVNLNPDTACNFDCVYCQVDRSVRPAVTRVDLPTLDHELRALLELGTGLFEEPEFRGVPPAYRRLNDIAFSGDGEPTAVPVFAPAAEIAARLWREFAPRDTKIVLITDACYLKRPAVRAALAKLDACNLEIWAKLDAGTEAHFQTINRPNVTLAHVLDNILDAARVRPIVIQSLFMRVHGQPPPAAEIEAYVDRLRALVAEGAQLRLVQVYTVARRTAEPYVTPLADEELAEIANQVRSAGFAVERYA